MASSLSGTISAKFQNAVQTVRELADSMLKLGAATLRHNTAAVQNAQQLKATRQEAARLRQEHTALKETFAPIAAGARYAGDMIGGLGKNLGSFVGSLEEAATSTGKFGGAIGGVVVAAAAFKVGMDVYNMVLENQRAQVKAAIDQQWELRDAILGAQSAQQQRSASAETGLAERRKTEGLNPEAEAKAESLALDPANGLTLQEARQGVNSLSAIKDPTIRNRAIDAAVLHHQAGGDFGEGARTIAESRGLWGRLGVAGGSVGVAGMLLQKDRNGLLYSGTAEQRRQALASGIGAVEGDATTSDAYKVKVTQNKTELENEGRTKPAVAGAAAGLVESSTPNAKLWTELTLRQDKMIQILQAHYEISNKWYNRLLNPNQAYADRLALNQADDRWQTFVLGAKQ